MPFVLLLIGIEQQATNVLKSKLCASVTNNLPLASAKCCCLSQRDFSTNRLPASWLPPSERSNFIAPTLCKRHTLNRLPIWSAWLRSSELPVRLSKPACTKVQVDTSASALLPLA